MTLAPCPNTLPLILLHVLSTLWQALNALRGRPCLSFVTFPHHIINDLLGEGAAVLAYVAIVIHSLVCLWC